MNILIIEDDILLANNIKKTFEKLVITNRIKIINTYEDFLGEMINIKYYDVLLTDIRLSNDNTKTGMEIIEIIRFKKYHIPIIVISCLGDLRSLEKAFNKGTNDYLIKPFRLKELQLRAIRWFKIYYKSLDLGNDNKKIYKKLIYNLDTNEYYYNSEIIQMSKKSKFVLSIFLSKPEKLVSDFELIEKIWGEEGLFKNKNIRIIILRLKQSLSKVGIDSWLENKRGEGYILKKI